jgi:hypothetical protein
MVWHKITGAFGKSNRLLVTRVDLDRVLKNPDYTPESLVNLFENDLGREYSKGKGVHEGYSLKRHTLMVMEQFEKYFSSRELPAGINTGFFRLILALHDIGVPEAIRQTGDKRNQHTFTVKTMERVLDELNFSEEETSIALALVSADPIGAYIKGRKGGGKTVEKIARMAGGAGLPFYEFLELLIIFYQVDAGSYTEDAGGHKSLDHLFVFDSEKGQMDFSVKTAAKIDQLKIYAEAIPASMWLDDHDWHDIAYNDLKEWVKKKPQKLESGKELQGRMFRYRRNLRWTQKFGQVVKREFCS